VRTHVNVEPSELFARVLALRPRGFFLFHNHPSGTLSASGPDLHLTQRVKSTAQQLGLDFLGHWIVTAQGEVLV
jgi:DNA repair protein RadC